MNDADEAAWQAEEKAREQREADLVKNRIEELHEQPIQGNFDAEHLKAVHANIFQDLPQHQPGVMREDTPDWTKHRGLEGQRDNYDVPYLSHDVEGHITDILDRFGGPDSLEGLTPEVAAERVAGLYGDLDHGHGFYEGNSRTLREFTRELAAEAGFALDWAKTGVGAQQRNELYLARDLAVYEREYPGLTEERAMQTDDRREYEAFFTVERLRAAVGERTLDALVGEGLGLARDKEQQRNIGGEIDASRGFQAVGDDVKAGLEHASDGLAELPQEGKHHAASVKKTEPESRLAPERDTQIQPEPQLQAAPEDPAIARAIRATNEQDDRSQERGRESDEAYWGERRASEPSRGADREISDAARERGSERETSDAALERAILRANVEQEKRVDREESSEGTMNRYRRSRDM